ncbi:hypothetical protein SV7mr_03640 [Stieleria bergensis]|uniref:Squalene cyclase C-terminal domain-containing protein n=1 Tax=Stieleria bergensis TaxID=2528025 RepID=A0A517SP29_9BACT|nr:hypothetical protein SV7mr_03640 [Planctomycetes bacterium SV_7m_r]
MSWQPAQGPAACFLLIALLIGLPATANGQQADRETSDTETAAETVTVNGKPMPLPDVAMASPETLQAAIDRGIDFLIKDQRPTGGWGSPTKTKGLNIFAPVPGAHDAFRIATTSLCVAALLEVAPQRAETQDTINRGEAYLMKHLPTLRRATGDAIYNVWGHIYSITALCRMYERFPEDTERREKIADLMREQFERLKRYESVDGGWGYYDFRYQSNQPTSSSISFVGGAGLVALHQAKSLGIEPPERMVNRAIAAIERQKRPDFSYLYGEYLKDRPAREINRPGGSLGRSQCCNVGLRLWGDKTITDEVIRTWLYRLYVRNGWLDIGRKRPIPHESWMQVAGYFYYFGHYYGALELELLPKEKQAPFKAMLAKLMLDRQETNGSWWDYPLYDYHRPYGTSFALMTLHRCQ